MYTVLPFRMFPGAAIPPRAFFSPSSSSFALPLKHQLPCFDNLARSFALFCVVSQSNCFPLNRLRALWKTPGVGSPSQNLTSFQEVTNSFPRNASLKHNRSMRPQADTDWIIAKAKALGFDLCGIARAEECTEPAHRDEWLARGYAGQMRYLHDARRAAPALALPEARSVIVCAINYNTAQPYSTEAAALNAAETSDRGAVASGPRGWLSRYAWGDDYHAAIGEKLENLVAAMVERFGDNFSARAYVDTGPVSERVAARQAGLGWLAKNTCLINPEIGSWLFLAVVLTSLELMPSLPQNETMFTPPPDLCGNCRLCLDACPTGALVEPYVLDARRCISYLTIELRDSIPEEFRSAMGWQVFGCDICQDVCPWNRQAPATAEAVFAPREKLVAPELDWLLSLTEEDFRRVFRGSAVRRTKWRGLLRNACIAAGNAFARGRRASGAAAPGKGVQEIVGLRARLADLAASPDTIVAEHAQWALAQLGSANAAQERNPQ